MFTKATVVGIACLTFFAASCRANEACFPDELAGASRVVFKALTPNADQDCWKRQCLDIKCHASRYLVCAFKALADRSRPNLVVRDDIGVSFYLEITQKFTNSAASILTGGNPIATS